jgi:hypothetical protein
LLWAPSAGADAGLGDDPASTTVTGDTATLDASANPDPLAASVGDLSAFAEAVAVTSAESLAEPATEPPPGGEEPVAPTDPLASPDEPAPPEEPVAPTDPLASPDEPPPPEEPVAPTDPLASPDEPPPPEEPVAPTDPLASPDEPAPPEEPVVPPEQPASGDAPADVEAPAAAPTVIPGEAVQARPPNDEAIDVDVGGDDVEAGPAPTPEPPVLPSQGPVDDIAVPALPSVGLPSALASDTAPDTALGFNGPTRGPVVTRDLSGGGATATARSNDRRSAALATYRLPFDGAVGSASERPRPAGGLVEQAPTPAAAAGQAPVGGSSSGGSAAGLLAIMAAFLFAACNLLLGRRLGLTVNAATGASVAIKLKRPG